MLTLRDNAGLLGNFSIVQLHLSTFTVYGKISNNFFSFIRNFIFAGKLYVRVLYGNDWLHDYEKSAESAILETEASGKRWNKQQLENKNGESDLCTFQIIIYEHCLKTLTEAENTTFTVTWTENWIKTNEQWTI